MKKFRNHPSSSWKISCSLGPQTWTCLLHDFPSSSIFNPKPPHFGSFLSAWRWRLREWKKVFFPQVVVAFMARRSLVFRVVCEATWIYMTKLAGAAELMNSSSRETVNSTRVWYVSAHVGSSCLSQRPESAWTKEKRRWKCEKRMIREACFVLSQWQYDVMCGVLRDGIFSSSVELVCLACSKF